MNSQDTIRIYKDKDLMEEITVLDMGIVNAGEVEKFTFWIKNISNAFLRQLEFSIEHSEVEILSAPVQLNAQAVDELVVEWSPTITLKEGLKAQLRVRGEELWG